MGSVRTLDLFESTLIVDLGSVQQSPEEAEVLFTLLAERGHSLRLYSLRTRLYRFDRSDVIT
jgi:hypothetical protein